MKALSEMAIAEGLVFFDRGEARTVRAVWPLFFAAQMSRTTALSSNG
jgi:hypothetical protein